MTEVLLRLAYLAIGVYAFSSALITQLSITRAGGQSAVDLFSIGSIWVSFVAFVLIVTWSSKMSSARSVSKVPESFLRMSFLTMGLFFFACALATTNVLTNPSSSTPEWFCVGGLWFAFLAFLGLTSLSSKSNRIAGGVDTVAAAA
jgi:hypothetical protein